MGRPFRADFSQPVYGFAFDVLPGNSATPGASSAPLPTGFNGFIFDAPAAEPWVRILSSVDIRIDNFAFGTAPALNPTPEPVPVLFTAVGLLCLGVLPRHHLTGSAADTK